MSLQLQDNDRRKHEKLQRIQEAAPEQEDQPREIRAHRGYLEERTGRAAPVSRMLRITSARGVFYANTLNNWARFMRRHFCNMAHDISHAVLPKDAIKIHRGVWRA